MLLCLFLSTLTYLAEGRYGTCACFHLKVRYVATYNFTQLDESQTVDPQFATSCDFSSKSQARFLFVIIIIDEVSKVATNCDADEHATITLIDIKNKR